MGKPQAAPSPTEGPPEWEDGVATIGDRYILDLGQPLPHLDTAGGKAFAVNDPQDPSASLYAIVHHPAVPHRQDVVRALMQAPVTNLLNPLLQEVLRPSTTGPERLVTLIEAPGGPSLAAVASGQPINGHRIRTIVVPALLKALTALHERKILHRAIRPQNIFFTNDSCSDVVLGDCFTAPPAADQSPHLEPIERATASPRGRGLASEEADLFALGASLLICHIGRVSDDGRDPEKFYTSRIAQGSFWAQSAGAEIPGIMGSLFRGLLNDDVDERWTLREVSSWLESALPSRRSVNQIWTFARPVTFRRETYSDRRLLAREFAKHPLEAAPFLRGLEFPAWIQNTVTTELFSDRLERLLDVRQDADLSSTRHGDHALVARVVSHLDPAGPIRFRDISVAIDGVGPALAHAFALGGEKSLDSYKRFFDKGVLPAAMEIVAERNPAVGKVAFDLERAIARARGDTLGAGLTRVLYDLNPSLPCLSPHFRDRWLATPEALLEALDEKAGQATELSGLLDGHVLAFFSSRVDQAQRLVDRIGVAKKDPVRGMSAIVDCLSFLQTALRPGPLVNLCSQVVKNLRPLATELRSKRRREAVLIGLERLGQSGDLARLSKVANLGRLKEQDRREFASAQMQLARIDRQRQQLGRPVQPSDPSARIVGYRLGSSVGWLVLLATIGFLAVGR